MHDRCIGCTSAWRDRQRAARSHSFIHIYADFIILHAARPQTLRSINRSHVFLSTILAMTRSVHGWMDTFISFVSPSVFSRPSILLHLSIYSVLSIASAFRVYLSYSRSISSHLAVSTFLFLFLFLFRPSIHLKFPCPRSPAPTLSARCTCRLHSP